MLRTYNGVLHIQVPYTVAHTERLLREMSKMDLSKYPLLRGFYEELQWQCSRAYERQG